MEEGKKGGKEWRNGGRKEWGKENRREGKKEGIEEERKGEGREEIRVSGSLGVWSQCSAMAMAEVAI